MNPSRGATAGAAAGTAGGSPGSPVHVVRVVRIDELTSSARQFVVVRADGGALPEHAPGSHVVVTAGPKRNAYSLTGSGIAPADYRFSVLRRGDGGGSDWLHENVAVGDALRIEGPTSAFPPEFSARKALLIAAGIGVTPVLSHLRAARAWGRDVEVVYGYRAGAAAHLQEVRRLAGPDLREAVGRRALRELVRERLDEQPWGTHAYACGPPAVLELFEEQAHRAGWPPARVHLERFVAPELEPGRAFTAVLRRSGRRLQVFSGTSLLEAALAAGVPIANMCRQGVCGQCAVAVTAGRVEHRDAVLTPEEREAHTQMLTCVSRAADDRLEIDA